MKKGYIVADNPKYIEGVPFCPVCNCVVECDMVDIGVGEQQSGPFHCEACGWVQKSPDFDFDEED